MQERVVFATPAEPRQIKQDACFFDFVRPVVPYQTSAPIGAVEDETVDPFGMAGGILDGDRAAPACGHNIEFLKRGGLDDAFEIACPGLERKIARIAVGQPTAARVVAQQHVVTREGVKPGPPGKALPLMFEM